MTTFWGFAVPVFPEDTTNNWCCDVLISGNLVLPKGNKLKFGLVSFDRNEQRCV